MRRLSIFLLLMYALPETALASTVRMASILDTTPAPTTVIVNLLIEPQLIDWQRWDISLNAGGSVHFNMPPSTNSVVQEPPNGGQLMIKAGPLSVTSAGLNGSQINLSPVPEASNSLMLLLGLGMLAFRRRLLSQSA